MSQANHIESRGTGRSRSVPATAGLVLCIALALVARDARAGGSSPVLALTSADAAGIPAGPRMIEAVGAFAFDDVVEDVFGLSLIVSNGARFVRYDQAGQVVTGETPLVADGLDAAEVEALFAAGSAASPPARLAGIARDRVTIVLPADFPSGTASVVLSAVFDGDSFVSNALAVSVP